jgi:hypothetical protein
LGFFFYGLPSIFVVVGGGGGGVEQALVLFL